MKKLLSTVFVALICFGLNLGTVSATDCLRIGFKNWDSVCLGINKKNSTEFRVSLDKQDLRNNSILTCYLTLPNKVRKTLNSCKGTFFYNWYNSDYVTISAMYVANDKVYSERFSTKIDFRNWEWAWNTNSYWSTNSSKSNNNRLDISANPSNPDTYEWVKLTLKTDRNYVGRIDFTKLQYRSSSSSSWSNISMTSSSYISDYSSEWSNGYYRMTSSDYGEVSFSRFIKFNKRWYYRIYVKDTEWNESYVQISVDSDSSSRANDKIELSTNRKSPSTSQYINLTIETDRNYTDKLYLSAKYRSSSSSSRSSISNTSSSYFSDYSSDWDNGYYRMRSYDDGKVTLNSLVKFRKDGYYRIYVKDTEWNESYLQFSVGDVDDRDSNWKTDWFSSSELAKLKEIYKSWPSMVSEMQRKYPSLKKNNYWITLSENFYKDMKDVIDEKKARNFDDYSDFSKAYSDWYKYTMQNI